MRSVYLHKDKSIFKVDELPADRFAESLGLAGAPKIKFLSKELAKKKKNASRSISAAQAAALEEREVGVANVSSEESDVDDGELHPSSDEEVEDDEKEMASITKPAKKVRGLVCKPWKCCNHSFNRLMACERNMTACLKGKTKIFFPNTIRS